MARPANHRIETLRDHIDHDFGCSAPRLLDQLRIDHFAECTGDDQWIHVDVERARTQMPGGRTIALGLLLRISGRTVWPLSATISNNEISKLTVQGFE